MRRSPQGREVAGGAHPAALVKVTRFLDGRRGEAETSERSTAVHLRITQCISHSASSAHGAKARHPVVATATGASSTMIPDVGDACGVRRADEARPARVSGKAHLAPRLGGMGGQKSQLVFRPQFAQGGHLAGGGLVESREGGTDACRARPVSPRTAGLPGVHYCVGSMHLVWGAPGSQGVHWDRLAGGYVGQRQRRADPGEGGGGRLRTTAARASQLRAFISHRAGAPGMYANVLWGN